MISTNKPGSKVFFFTNEVEISFVRQEVLNLSGSFDRVIVYAFNKGKEMNFPENVQVIEADYSGYSTAKMLSAHFFSVLGISIKEFFRAPVYLLHPSRYLKAISQLLRCFYLADEFKRNAAGKFEKKDVFYTFWFNQWATVLSIFVQKGIIDDYCSRAHGTDLYEHRVPETKTIPFRWYQMKQVKNVFSVSEKGMDYLKQRYPAYREKVFTSYLGTSDEGLAAFNEKEIFTIVSCAHVRNIKRIHLIPGIIARLEFDVKWIHIGNENPASNDPAVSLYFKNKESLKLKKNVTVECKGKLTSGEILNLYRTTSINLFISVSETEGLPVTMMEAISFGIPVLSTDVGGCNEIVNETTGILVPKEFDPAIVADCIEQFRRSAKNSLTYRSKVREYWKNNFDGSINFPLFLAKINNN
jgi:glycosyltransferase involved in cell wall biosynthesis